MAASAAARSAAIKAEKNRFLTLLKETVKSANRARALEDAEPEYQPGSVLDSMIGATPNSDKVRKKLKGPVASEQEIQFLFDNFDKALFDQRKIEAIWAAVGGLLGGLAKEFAFRSMTGGLVGGGGLGGLTALTGGGAPAAGGGPDLGGLTELIGGGSAPAEGG